MSVSTYKWFAAKEILSHSHFHLSHWQKISNCDIWLSSETELDSKKTARYPAKWNQIYGTSLILISMHAITVQLIVNVKNNKLTKKRPISLGLTDRPDFFLLLASCLLLDAASIRLFMLPSRAVFSAFSLSRFSFCSRCDFCRRFFSRRSRSLSVDERSVLPTNSRFCLVFNHTHTHYTEHFSLTHLNNASL